MWEILAQAKTIQIRINCDDYYVLDESALSVVLQRLIKNRKINDAIDIIFRSSINWLIISA